MTAAFQPGLRESGYVEGENIDCDCPSVFDRVSLEASYSSDPLGSIGNSCERAMKLRADARKAKGITWTKEQHSRDDWPRAWEHIEPLLGDCDPKTVTPEVLLDLRTLVAEKVSENEAYRVIKVWRSFWQQMALFGFRDGT